MMLAYSFTPIAVLLVVHYLVVIKLDINTAFLRIVTLLVPFTVGFLLFRKTGRGLGAAFLLGTFIGITSVAGMLAVVGLLDSTTVIPSSLFEWQEAIEYVMGIALAAVVGSAVARAVDVALLTSH
jgi:hypothetical protein